MFLERSEVDQVAVLLERGHLVADGLGRIGRSLANRRANLLQDYLNIRRKADDVVVNGCGFGGCGAHVFPIVQPNAATRLLCGSCCVRVD